MMAALLTHGIPADVSGWWVSEKLDGIRAIWTGTALLTRHGKRLLAPEWFTAGLPNRRLDGELYMGRRSFDRLVSVIQRKNSDWAGVTFHVFDLAESGAFEDREAVLESLDLPSHVITVEHSRLVDSAELDALELEIVSTGGEGCVIRRPGSSYRPGRMGDVIKIKRLVADVDRWQG